MLIGDMQVSGAEGSQVLDLQGDALLATGVDPAPLHEGRASGERDRSGPGACLKSLRPGDALIGWKLDRLGRDLRCPINLVHALTGRGVGLRVLAGEGATIGTMSANGRLMFGVLAALAEFEHGLIVESARAGPARARCGGRQCKMPPAELCPAQAGMGRRETRVGELRTDLCAELGITRRTPCRHVDPQGRRRQDGETLLRNRRAEQEPPTGPGAMEAGERHA